MMIIRMESEPRLHSVCCLILFCCFPYFLLSNVSEARVGVVFELAPVLVELVHLFQLCGGPSDICTYFACVWLSFPFFLEGKYISIESVALIQTKQHSRTATTSRVLWLTHGNWELMTKCKQWRGANWGPLLANHLLWHVKKEAGKSPAAGALPFTAASSLSLSPRAQRCVLFRDNLLLHASQMAFFESHL